MYFSNLCVNLGIPREEIASILGIEQRLVDAIDGGKAEVANRSSRDRSLENAAGRLQARAGKSVENGVLCERVDDQDILQAIQGDRRDNSGAPLPAELSEWERDVNEELDANVDNAHAYLAKQGVRVGVRKPREDLRSWIIDKLKLRGALIDAGSWWVGPIRLVGYAVKVPPPVRS